MAARRAAYAPEYRRQMVELVRAGRTPGELAGEKRRGRAGRPVRRLHHGIAEPPRESRRVICRSQAAMAGALLARGSGQGLGLERGGGCQKFRVWAVSAGYVRSGWAGGHCSRSGRTAPPGRSGRLPHPRQRTRGIEAETAHRSAGHPFNPRRPDDGTRRARGHRNAAR